MVDITSPLAEGLSQAFSAAVFTEAASPDTLAAGAAMAQEIASPNAFDKAFASFGAA